MIRAALIACTLAVAAEATDLDRLADAIRIAEGYRGVPGAMGEEGPYQIRAATWAQHMPGIAFARAVHEPTARICARRHLTWLALRLEGRGVPASPFNLALCWNAGLARTLSGRAPERAYDYARRVENLYLLGAKGQNTLNSPPETTSRVKWGLDEVEVCMDRFPRRDLDFIMTPRITRHFAHRFFPGARNGRLAAFTPTNRPLVAR